MKMFNWLFKGYPVFNK